MTRDEIYDHLAQVYLGKRKATDEKKKKQFSAWLVINIFITGLIFFSVFYGLTAFLTGKKPLLQSNIIFELNGGPIQISYNFKEGFPPVKTFALAIPSMNIEKYQTIRFSIRAREEGSPGIVKVVFKNKRNEKAEFYVRGINFNWQEISIPLEEFYEITDWNSVKDISFVLESWNVEKKKGLILIEDIRFST
ncbi:hypothetical protein MNBD_UNCLBAC01-1010 [hydrothermal vent metagenome]|uniref:CBM11 domain-containing protein n=1 Tax=hydrothermal vent metagenome TaxID=652676 RepID=A0A3B1DC12_9ZZZZ